jgi:hypothetical protein
MSQPSSQLDHVARKMNHEPNVYRADEDTRNAVSVYTPLTLAFYDLAVLQFSNSFVWQCSSHVLLDFYNQHISDKHLDIGVGTGYFLDRCRFPRPPRDCTVRSKPSQPRKSSKALASLQSILLLGNALQPSISACSDLVPSRSTISCTASRVIWRARASCLRT